MCVFSVEHPAAGYRKIFETVEELNEPLPTEVTGKMMMMTKLMVMMMVMMRMMMLMRCGETWMCGSIQSEDRLDRLIQREKCWH